MAAIAISAKVDSESWTKAKPKDYKGADLDKALSAWETVKKKAPAATSKPQSNSIKGYEDAIQTAEGVVKYLKECDAQLDKVIATAKKTAAELSKLAEKLKGSDQKKYTDAASIASLVGSGAGELKKHIA